MDAENGLQRNEQGRFTLGAMSRGVIMTRRQKCLLHPFYRAAQRHGPKSYRAGHWYRQGNSQQQLLYHGDITPSVNGAAIFDAPTPCCGVNYRCRAVPSVNVALINSRQPACGFQPHETAFRHIVTQHATPDRRWNPVIHLGDNWNLSNIKP